MHGLALHKHDREICKVYSQHININERLYPMHLTFIHLRNVKSGTKYDICKQNGWG